MSFKYKILDLFSGLGGFSLGLERTGHFETVAFCDNDKFSKAILDKHWKGIKVYEDVREITKEKFREDGTPFPDIITGGSNVANSKRIRQQGSREHVRPVDTEENKVRQTSRFNNGSQGEKGWWLVEPNVGRVAHGVSGRVHRLKGLGNSIVPQIVEEIGKAIIKAEQE